MSSQSTVLPARIQQAASSFVAETELADAVLALDRVLTGGEVDPAATQTCERAGVDITDRAAVQELLAALTTRLSEMTQGRAGAFQSALEAYPPPQRFSLPALAEVLWPSLENLRRAGPGHATSKAVHRIIQQYEPQLKELYRRHSGRSQAAWEATYKALSLRLPLLFSRYAEIMDREDESITRKLASSPEGVGVMCMAAGLLTLRMPVSTPLVCATLGLVGYAGLAPVVQRLQNHLKDTVMATLRAEDAAIQQLSERGPSFTLSQVVEEVRPILQSAILGGTDEHEDLMVHVAPTLVRLREAAERPGGPGAAYADAIVDIVRTKYVPRFHRVAVQLREAAESSLMARLVRDPVGAGILTAIATLPLTILAASATPLPLWVDAPAMAAVFYYGGATITRLLSSPGRQLHELHQSMKQEEALLNGLFPVAQLSPGGV
ncbi:MAG: hypothetical protein AB2A00_19980 [Myxococcota bacterium]